MKNKGFAFFVNRPRTIEDLMLLHPAEQERRYEIVDAVCLAKIDYENFITDMLADRAFIEDRAALCDRGEIWRCILVRQRGCRSGILVMPADGGHVEWAAYCPG